MNVYINSRFLTQPITGVQRFAIELSKALVAKDDRFRFIAPRAVLHKELAEQLKVEFTGNRSGHLWEQLELPRFLKKQGSPLLLNLCNTGPLSYSHQVLTLHDMAFRVQPRWFSKTFATYYNFLVPRVAQKASHVLTVSEFSQQEIVRYTGIDKRKISVVYNAIPEVFRSSVPGERPCSTDYVLAVGSLDPRKNLATVVRAFELLKGTPLKLIIIGGRHKAFSDPELDQLIANNPAIELLGYQNGPTLATYYAHAAVFINLSLYEGFGIPNLEAMAQGCPVIASDIPVFREVLADAVQFTDPRNPALVAESIATVTNDTQLQQTLREKGLQQANNYSYQRSAEKVISVLTQLEQTGRQHG